MVPHYCALHKTHNIPIDCYKIAKLFAPPQKKREVSPHKGDKRGLDPFITVHIRYRYTLGIP